MMRTTYSGSVMTLEEFSRARRVAQLELSVRPGSVTFTQLDEADLRELIATAQALLQDWDSGPLGGANERNL